MFASYFEFVGFVIFQPDGAAIHVAILGIEDGSIFPGTAVFLQAFDDDHAHYGLAFFVAFTFVAFGIGFVGQDFGDLAVHLAIFLVHFYVGLGFTGFVVNTFPYTEGAAALSLDLSQAEREAQGTKKQILHGIKIIWFVVVLGTFCLWPTKGYLPSQFFRVPKHFFKMDNPILLHFNAFSL